MEPAFMKNALAFARRAAGAEAKGDWSGARDLYDSAVKQIDLAIKWEKNDTRKGYYQGLRSDYAAKRNTLRGTEAPSVAPPDAVVPTREPRGPPARTGANGAKEPAAEEEDEESSKLRKTIKASIVSEAPNVQFSEIAGLAEAKNALSEAVIFPMRFPHLFTGKRRPWTGILLYGPPGTGKSYLAKAVATEAKSTYYSLSSADLVSKWVGESERLIKMLFVMARESRPSVVFIDEVDSICGARSDNESEASRRIKTEFLVQMNGGTDGTQEGVLVLAATNTPWALDPGVRRRFEQRIHIPLPDHDARVDMLRIHLGDTPHLLTKGDFFELAEKMDGYSGADISIVVRKALMEPFAAMRTTDHFRETETGSGVYLPCTADDAGAKAMKWTDLKGSNLVAPPADATHFNAAIAKTKPSVGAADLIRHIQFTEEYGVEG
jgi:vacuolar protein-sorting-associated protein 4